MEEQNTVTQSKTATLHTVQLAKDNMPSHQSSTEQVEIRKT